MEVEYESSDGDYDNRDVVSWLYSSVVKGWEWSEFRSKLVITDLIHWRNILF